MNGNKSEMDMVTLLAYTALLLMSDSSTATHRVETNQPSSDVPHRHGRSRPVAPSNDVTQWVTSADYPVNAWAQRRFGTTGVNLHVDTDGSVKYCEVTLSSGYADLDAATCQLLTQRAHFLPELDSRGRPVASSYSKRVRWQIPGLEEDAPPPVGGFRDVSGILVRIHVNRERVVDQCRIEPVHTNPSPEQRTAICAAMSSSLLDSLPPVAPDDGFWVEIRQLGYVYGVNPDWDHVGAVRDGTPPSAAEDNAPLVAPASLPPGVT